MPTQPSTRQRIIDTAYDLFSCRGVRDVGIDEVIAKAGVAKATLYRHFPSKNALVIAFLQEREQRWTLGLVLSQAAEIASAPEEQLLAIFDVLEEWFLRDDFDSSTFIKVLLEMGPQHPIGQAAIQHLHFIRSIVAGLATDAGLREPTEFARSWQILMKGSIVSATEGDPHAAQRAKAMAVHLIEDHRVQASRGRTTTGPPHSRDTSSRGEPTATRRTSLDHSR